MRSLVWKYSMFIMKGIWALVKVALLVILRDLLVKRQVEVRTQELARREAQQRMNEFLSVASHELKTPLTSIKGNIQLAGRKLKSKLDTSTPHTSDASGVKPDESMSNLLSEARELLERTDKQITQLSRLVNTLLESSRITANTMDLLLDLCELDTLVREVMQDAKLIPQTRVFNVQLPDSEESVLVMADANRIKQVITHLLSNAHKYSPAEGRIDLVLETEDHLARVSVADEGPGIPLGEQDKIWERYYRVPTIEVLNGSEIGLGLGLHISRTIIEQHHGRIGLQSNPGIGSTFWFTLPLSVHTVV